MSNERQLSALLHELQHARSPLAQARVLARAWRTVRQLSPTDRRLLARHVGFDGAEEILEGLSRRTGGLAPAMLLRALTNARATDSTAVTELLAAIRDPERRDEAISLGAELASDLVAEPEVEAVPDVGSALEELWAVDDTNHESPADKPASVAAVEPEVEVETEDPVSPELEPTSVPWQDGSAPRPPVEPTPRPGSETKSAQPPPPPPVVDWSRWHSTSEDHRPNPTPSADTVESMADSGPRRFEARAVMGAMGAAESPFSQLRVLRRELAGFAGSSLATLRELVEAFPDGWTRRRALCALLDAGIPSETDEAIQLIALLEREIDRRWCLGILARSGGLGGSRLERALELVSSPSSRRRLRTARRG